MNNIRFSETAEENGDEALDSKYKTERFSFIEG